MYLTSIRIGVASAVVREWGDVDEFTGINVIAATQVMIVLTFLGVIGLQIGQYWAEVEDQRVFQRALEEEREEQKQAEAVAAATAEEEVKPEGKSTSVKTSKASKTSSKKK